MKSSATISIHTHCPQDKDSRDKRISTVLWCRDQSEICNVCLTWPFYFVCAPRSPQNQCWHREVLCFSSTWYWTHARSTLNGGGRGDGNTRWKSKVKYWPLLGVASFRWINLLTRPVTCRTLYGLKTTTHKHTRLRFMTSFHCKQHVAGSSSDVPAP